MTVPYWLRRDNEPRMPIPEPDENGLLDGALLPWDFLADPPSPIREAGE